jgi:hypothetical protein
MADGDMGVVEGRLPLVGLSSIKEAKQELSGAAGQPELRSSGTSVLGTVSSGLWRIRGASQCSALPLQGFCSSKYLQVSRQCFFSITQRKTREGQVKR